MVDVTIRIAGANGDGVESSGNMLLKTVARNGLHAYGYRGYQSIIRGGHVWYQVRIGEAKLYSPGNGIDVFVALNQDGIENQKEHFNKNAIIIYDPSKVNVDSIKNQGYRLIGIPLLDTAVKISGDPIMRNVVAIGAILRIIGVNIEAFDEVAKSMFLRKGEAIVSNNVNAARTGYNYEGVETFHPIRGDGKTRFTLDGNTALSMGSYAAGCKLYAGYPMTPASTILQWFAAHQDKGVLAKQTEDELAAINTAIGGSFAGVRSACGTSGGGFSLMVEALGFTAMLEVPLVVFEAQRTGPSTGLPTKTEQADLLFIMHASQGEFPRIVVSPRNVEECFYIAAEAFNLADKYQCPVIVMSDLFLSEHIESIDGFDLDSININRGKIAEKNNGERFKRYSYSEDGVSPRAFPGTPGLEHIAASDEHDEHGDLVSDALSGIGKYVEVRKKMHGKRMSKIESMLKNESIFVPKVRDENSDYFFVCFGSTTDQVIEATEMLKSRGKKFGVISFNYLMPLDKEKTKKILKGKKLIDVECNFTAQLAQVIMANTGIEIPNRILRYDGEVITSAEIVESALGMIDKF